MDETGEQDNYRLQKRNHEEEKEKIMKSKRSKNVIELWKADLEWQQQFFSTKYPEYVLISDIRSCEEMIETRETEELKELEESGESDEQFQNEFDKWTSGYREIDEFIQKIQLNANKHQEIIEGGFGIVFKAKWLDRLICSWDYKLENWERFWKQNVCLSSLVNSTNENKFLQEIKNQLKFQGKDVIATYSITKNPTKNKYVMVMNYAQYGSSLMHKDFYPGNIVNQTLTICYITDFGLCKSVTENNPEKTYGVISYMTPETLIREYIQASDIYSFDMVM
ncbi:hypothetical protein Glove_18g52 [Diversispora epigaea]|uniref:Protein kinase domain-containing protein n=1 Tax=Diversispora epigaea TaxID=1348612 RepID=A0A397JV95_9GLOM|nr:hypothetical protein Glove_18g52 [Diversispora epigaea]